MDYIIIKGEQITYQNLTIEDIVAWCQENGEVKWLKAKVNETKIRNIYPKGANGKVDRKAAPIGNKVVPISFIEVKRDFAKKFCPEILPVAKPKKLSMLELVNAL